VGEITPAYALLSTDDIRRVHALAPDAKILFLLRNPIERAWSHVRYAWTRDRFDQIDDIGAVRDFIDSSAQEERSDYLATLDRWTSIYDSAQIHIAFFDDLRDAPERLITDVANFLDISPVPMMSSLQESVNKSREKQMPSAIRGYLTKKYEVDLRKLKDRIGDHAASWYENL